LYTTGEDERGLTRLSVQIQYGCGQDIVNTLYGEEADTVYKLLLGENKAEEVLNI